MTNEGRRAADRRRERGGVAPADDAEPGTMSGMAPLSVAEGDVSPMARVVDDYDEVDEESETGSAPLLSADASAEAPEPSSSQRRARSQAPRSGGGRGVIVDEEPLDAEKSFVRELQRRPKKVEATRSFVEPEATQVRESKVRRAKRGGAFVVVGPVDTGPATNAQQSPDIGIDAGSQLAIAHYPALLGRTANADVRLPDAAVSLRHAELAYDTETATFSIIDLGSSSGTLRNGVVLTGRATIDAGDVVTVGRTELRFVRTDAAPSEKIPEPVAEAPPLESTERLPERTSASVRAARDVERRAAQEALEARRQAVRKKALTVIAACALLLVSTAVVTIVYRKAFADDAPAQIRHQISVLLAEAKAHLYEGDVDGALARAETVLGLDENNLDAQSLERVIRTEMTARDALQLALRMGDEDRDDEALQALMRVADTSVFAKDRDRLRQTLASRALVRSLRAVENLLDAGRTDDALARAAQHVKRFPDDEGGKALLARVQAVKDRGVGIAPALQAARAAFAEGRADDARRIAKDAGYTGFALDVDRFEQSLAAGKQALARFDGALARAPLDEAFRLLGSLGAQPQSPMFQTVQKPYVDALYLTGTEKLEAGDGCGAARDLFKAARVLPSDQRLRGVLQDLQARAEQGAVKARGAKAQDSERSQAIAREHLCYARSGTSTYDELRALAN